MAIRSPLPDRRSLQNLDGLRTAVSAGVNSVSNTVITPANCLGYINAAEDDLLLPLKLIWMKRNDPITLAGDGSFDLSTMTYPVTEIISLYQKTTLNVYQSEYEFDRKDLSTFRKYQGSVQAEPIYTTDGNIIKTWPYVNIFGQTYLSYYTDWAKMGDLLATSTLQQQVITITGTATATGTVTIQTGGQTAATLAINNGDTAATIETRLSALQIPYAVDAGGSTTYWTAAASPTSAAVTFTAPAYVSSNVTLTITGSVAGISLTNATTQTASIKTVQTNWFLLNYPYVYYYGALKHAFLFLDDQDRAKWANEQAQKQVALIQEFSDRAEVSDISDGFNYNNLVQW